MWIITGGAGFIGSALIAKLNHEGLDDLWVVDHLGRSEKWKNLRGRRFRDYLEADDFLARLSANRVPAARVEGIVHLGACSSTTETDASFLIRNNFAYSQALAQWALAKRKRFLYASSAATYGDGAFGYTTDLKTTQALKPLNMYGYSKQLFDLWALRARVLDQMVGIKFFNIFGPNEYHKGEMRSVVVKAFEQIRAGGQARLFKSYRPEFKDGEQQRDFLYVKDAANVVYGLMKNRSIKGLVNLGSGRPRTWNALMKAVFVALDRPARIEYVEMPEPWRAKYQYHTAADMRWLGKLKVPAFMPLENAVQTYVRNYLNREDPYL